ncbi:MAG: alpha-L-fucosidase [Bacteroidales bacterium]
MNKTIVLFSFILIYNLTSAQSEQNFETDTVILNKIEQWQDLKFGFMMHWGFYSQWSVVESWSICNEPWIDRGGVPYNEYVSKYQALNKTFNPTQFNPDEWATLAYDAGMKYMVFTTKHHDGFCMYSTKQTNYSITDSSCPFSTNPKADITKAMVNAFRTKGFWCGLYFSKPDWHNPDYWAPEWATPDRNVNYNPKDHPERWNRFVDFTYNQIKELTTQYGDIDILWLDGGWIRPEWSLTEESRPWLGCKGWIQDVNMPKIAQMARQNNPDLLIVDRSVHGKYENYRTPEKEVPDSILPYPWETCMTMGNSWSYVKDDEYKSTNTLIHLLVDIISKGGNLLLNVGPSPEGKLPEQAIDRLHAIGDWMKINGQAIYSTHPLYPYKYGNVRFTKGKNGKIYIFYLLNENESIPSTIHIPTMELTSGFASILGNSTKLRIKQVNDGYNITIPEKVTKSNHLKHAVVFEVN